MWTLNNRVDRCLSSHNIQIGENWFGKSFHCKHFLTWKFDRIIIPWDFEKYVNKIIQVHANWSKILFWAFFRQNKMFLKVGKPKFQIRGAINLFDRPKLEDSTWGKIIEIKIFRATRGVIARRTLNSKKYLSIHKKWFKLNNYDCFSLSLNQSTLWFDPHVSASGSHMNFG